MRPRDVFTTVHTEGGLLPSDLLQRIANGDKRLDGLTPTDYHLGSGERLNEAISRSWNRLLGVWTSFSEARDKLPENDLGTSLTRERWLLILFQELGYGRLTAPDKMNTVIEGKSYPISHSWQNAPVHLVGFRVDLDRRMPGVAGAARSSPHGLMQEFLNRTEKHLWGFLSNGRRLRILRDNISLTRQSYVEFDLEGMMDGEVYADFALLWLLCHQSRIEGEKAEQCWLEKWAHTAQEQGTRALDHLRDGVEQAIKSLGGGFLAHPANKDLCDRLRSGALNTQDYYRQLVRLVYRMIFLFVAEDRGLLFDPKAAPAAHDCYMAFYSTARLRRLAERRRGTKHPDLFRTLRLVMEQLGHDRGCPELALPALGSFLWSADAIGDLGRCDIANVDFLDALRALAFTREGNIRRAVDYHNLGSEELGSVYESLLEMHPQINADAAAFDLKVAAGHERKTTGSYYTHSSLVHCLLDSALDPILEAAAKKQNPEQAILNLKVCDPASGSGHFLIAAAHRMAKRLATVRTGDEESSPEAIRQALRDVIGHCVYGVDINPMSVELCKVSLWMEALEPGKPLSFLDAHILCGNSLLGATPALLRKGIPDEAFEPIEGDDKRLCADYRKQNKRERAGQKSLFDVSGQPWDRLGDLPGSVGTLEAIDDSSIEGVHRKQQMYEQVVRSMGYLYGKFWADTWCAAFVWTKAKDEAIPYAITEEVFRNIEKNPHFAPPWLRKEVERLAAQYQFFHWHIAFPSVFRIPPQGEKPETDPAGWNGGFDVVVGNPPWDMVELSEKEFFASRDSHIAEAPTARQRQRLIQALAGTDPKLFSEFVAAKRGVYGTRHFVQCSGRFPYSSNGRINMYPLFTENAVALVADQGRGGIVVPSAISMDAYNAPLFKWLVESKRLYSLYDFDNTRALFPEVHRCYRFCLLTFTGVGSNRAQFNFCFYAHDVSDLRRSERIISLSLEQIVLFSPNTLAPPMFVNAMDAALAKRAYDLYGVLVNSRTKQNPWAIAIQRMLSLSDPGDMFRRTTELTADDLSGSQCVWTRLLGGKAIHHFEHRYATFDADEWRLVSPVEHKNPDFRIRTEYYVRSEEVVARLADKQPSNWLLVYRDVTNATNEHTTIAAVIPPSGCDTTCRNLFSKAPPHSLACLLACLNSCAFDYFARQKIIGMHLGAGVFEQLPVLPPSTFDEMWTAVQLRHPLWKWLLPRVIELSYTAWDIQPFARDCGWSGPPFRWDEERRFLLRCELDAAFFHLYLGREEEWKRQGTLDLLRYFPTPRHAVDYIMDTFPIVKRRDEQAHGRYRTKETILEIYDNMARMMIENAAVTSAGQQPTACYQTRLDPPPGPLCDAQGNFIPMEHWYAANWPAHIHMPRAKEVPVAAAQAIAEQVEEGLAVLYALALLHTWGKPADRRSFELAMILMEKDALRERILKRKPTIALPQAQPVSVRLGNIDEFLAELAGSDTLRVTNAKGRQIVALGPNAPTRATLAHGIAGTDAFAKAQQTLEAISILEEQNSSLELFMGASDYGAITIALP